MKTLSTFCILIFLAFLNTSAASVSRSSSVRRVAKIVDTESLSVQQQQNATNTTKAPSVTPPNPPTPSNPDDAPITPPSSTPPPTHSPTKKYEPSPDNDENEDNGDNGTENKKPNIGLIILWVVIALAGLAALCYFRDPIAFFFASAWKNTRRHGCKGCLRSFCPCVFGSRSGGDVTSSEPLDQIIFETDDANADMRRGLME